MGHRADRELVGPSFPDAYPRFVPSHRFRFRPPTPAATPELRWVLSAAFSPPPHPADGLDPGAALELGRRLALLPRIAARCDLEAVASQFGTDVSDRLRSIRARAQARELLLDATLDAVGAAAADLRLDLAAIKGRALALAGHALPGARPSTDLDLLAPPERIDELHRELRRRGFVEVPGTRYEHQAATLRHPASDHVELHRLLPGVRLAGRASADLDDLDRAGLLVRLPAPRPPRVKVPEVSVLIAHALVHALSQHGLQASYPGWLLIGDLIDLDAPIRAADPSLRDVLRWTTRDLSFDEAAAALELAGALAAGEDPLAPGACSDDAAALARHFVATATDPDYAAALKARWLESPVTDRPRSLARLERIAAALVPPRRPAPGTWTESASSRARRWILRPFELIAKGVHAVSMRERPPGRRSVRRPRRFRAAAVVAATTAALAALALALADHRDRVALTQRVSALVASEQPLDGLNAALEREADPGERRLVAARTLYHYRERAGLDSGARADRLEAASEFAAGALARLPGSWEAAMLLGASRFEHRTLRRDTRLFSSAREWEQPLAIAVARSHGSPRAEETLAAAYLEVWPALSENKRETAAALLKRTFEDRGFRGRHLERWVTIAGSIARAVELLPADAETLSFLGDTAWRRGEMESAVDLWSRQRRELHRELDARLDSASDPRADRDRALSGVVQVAPTGLDFAPLVERAAIERPAWPASPALSQAAQRWLSWAAPLCLVGDCPLSAAALDRLGAAARDLPAEIQAFVALASGNDTRAELLARRSEALWSEPWAPFLLLAAKRRIASGEVAEARELLGETHRSVRSRAIYAWLARAAGLAGAEIEAPLRGEQWQPDQWSCDSRQPCLELAAGRASGQLAIGWHRPLQRDAALLIEWDGGVLAPVVVRRGDRQLVLDLEVLPGPHLLRLEARVGGIPELGVTSLN